MKGETALKNKLTAKEKLFCLLFASSRDARGSAARAGYLSPAKAAVKLLNRAEIKQTIEAEEASRGFNLGEIRDGLRHLAFGSAADAVMLMIKGDELSSQEIEELDLFNVAEIKRPKGGGLEIKFFDRIKALEKLASSGEGAGASANDLIRALDEGAAGLSDSLRKNQ